MFYAIRHGATRWNAEGRFQGRSDIPLSREGRIQAEQCAQRLTELVRDGQADGLPRAIVTSPLERAVATAEVACDVLGLPRLAIERDGRLREAGFGSWEGLTTLDVKARFPEERRSRKQDRWGFVPPGGESFDDLAAAMQSFVSEHADDCPKLVVTHSGNMRVLLALYAGMDRTEAIRAPIGHEAIFACGLDGLRVL